MLGKLTSKHREHIEYMEGCISIGSSAQSNRLKDSHGLWPIQVSNNYRGVCYSVKVGTTPETLGAMHVSVTRGQSADRRGWFETFWHNTTSSAK